MNFPGIENVCFSMKGRRLASAIIVATALTIGAASAAPAHPDDRTTATLLFNELLQLRAQAEAIVEHPHAPKSMQMERQFHAHLERYQDRADRLAQSVEPAPQTEPEGDLYAITSSLSGVDELLYNAVYEGTSRCERRRSNLDLEVVDAYVAHLRRLFAGEPDARWQPPQLFTGAEAQTPAACT